MRIFLFIFIILATQLRRSDSYIVSQDIKGRIINGQEAKPLQFPYLAFLEIYKGYFRFFWCGGSVIGKNWILTAAHCTTGSFSTDIYLGNIERNEGTLFTVQFENYVIHPNFTVFSSKGTSNDISLIKTPNIEFTAAIQPIKLPRFAYHFPLYDGEMATVVGWGRINEDSDEYARNLQYANIKIIQNRLCFKTYGYNLNDGNICASTDDSKLPAAGDSGGPLVFNSTGDLVQIGIISYYKPSPIRNRNFPFVFTHLSHYLKWIRNITNIGYY